MTSKIDQTSLSFSSAALLTVPYSVTPGESRNFDLTSSNIASSNTTNDPAYLFSQIKSSEWIQRHGLKSQRLTFDQILQQIGFKRVESFDPVIGKTVTAKYAGNLYHEVQHDNGDRYVLTCRPEKLRQYHTRLTQMLYLLRKRLAFITNGSRRLFGVIHEPNVCLVCDCKTIDHRLFNQFQQAFVNLLKEQITRIKKFNIIWISNDNEQFREQPIDVTSSNIDQAIDWVCARKYSRNKVSISATCEAVLKGFTNNADCIYLISEGDSSDLAREMLRDNIVKTRLSLNTPIPVNVVSLFCHNNETLSFLRSIAQIADGSYFCYKIKGEISDLKAPSNLNDPTRIQLQDDKIQIGTNALTPIADYPIDITLIYKEIIQCQNIIDRIEKILGFIRDERQNTSETYDGTKSLDGFNASGNNNFQRSLIVQSSTLLNDEDMDVTSEEWLKSFGIDGQKLDFFSVLQSAAFRHCDGVVTLLKPPDDSDETKSNTPANPENKLINAIYCDQFAHVAWPDGTIRHVHVTPELHRDYERRIRALLEKIRARLSWLKKGSRDVFGSILENNIYVLIDTSKSMQNHLGFVKDKLSLLIQDQLFAKERINMVAFNSIINPWRDRLTKTSDTSTFSQIQPWINGLNADGSTNTLAALRFALADSATEAIYLLTDGRPDQNERHILSQVQYRQSVPIHTISFNCQDQTANQFLFDLAKQTGGRFHAFNYGFNKESAVEIPESEDVGNLKRELNRGEEELKRIAALRDECLNKAWSRDNAKLKYKTRQINESSTPLQLRSNITLDVTRRPSSSTMSNRLSRKKRPTINQNRKRRSHSATNIVEQKGVINLNPDSWLLPETKDYLKRKEDTEKSTTDNENEQKTETIQVETPKLKTPFGDVKTYLKRNSLVARNLTIFDVLYPTTVTVKDPRHIQVIDRSVMSKVWDDILPLTYGSYVGKLRLVNHYAVDLEKYERQLKTLITDYFTFVSNFIWKNLTDEDKRKIGPHLNWNNLSKDEQTKITQEISTEEHTSQTALENFAWRKLTDEEQNQLLSRPVVYQDENKSLLKNRLKDAEADSTLKGVQRMDVEIDRAIKFLQISTDLRQLQKRPDIDSKPKNDEKPKIRPKSSVDRSVGQRVICRYDFDGFFYSGIMRKNSDGRMIVQFLTGIEQDTVGHTILPINGAIAQPHLCINDYVLVRQLNENEEFWAPGIVIVPPSPHAQPPLLFTVQVYTPSPREAHVQRRDILKISMNLFQQTVLYLQNLQRSKPLPILTNQSRPNNFENSLRKQLEPLTAKVEQLHKSHMKRYNQLRTTLQDQMEVIKDLQEKSKTTTESQSEQNQTIEISLKPTSDRPETANSISSRRSSINSDKSKIITTPKPSITNITPKDLIQPNTNVFAIWFDDDCLVYEGTVIERRDNANTYLVARVDQPRLQSFIAREDLFLDTEPKRVKNEKSQQFVLVQYPKDWRYCWKPAVIMFQNQSQTYTHIRFYDGVDKEISNNENIIPITTEQFERYARARIAYEKSLINQTIVGLNDETKVFMLGTVLNRIESGHKFEIEWCDTTKSSQDEQHLFGAIQRRIQFHVDDFVLALDNDQCIYKPAQIKRISDDQTILTVRFSDPIETNRNVDVQSILSFAMSPGYHKEITRTLYQ